jgi:hypothetical protein
MIFLEVLLKSVGVARGLQSIEEKIAFSPGVYCDKINNKNVVL